MKNLILALSLLLTGCASYVSPLCDEGNRRDLPNFEGTFTTVITQVDKAGSHTDRSQFVISRLSRGQYLVEQHDGATRASVCEIGGHFYTENEKGWSSGIPTKGFVAFQVSANGDSSFDLTALGLDSKVLDAQGVPYQIFSPPPSPKSGTVTADYEAIVADNTKVPAGQFVQLLEPQSYKVTLRPDGSRLTKVAARHVHGKSSKFN